MNVMVLGMCQDFIGKTRNAWLGLLGVKQVSPSVHSQQERE